MPAESSQISERKLGVMKLKVITDLLGQSGSTSTHKVSVETLSNEIQY